MFSQASPQPVKFSPLLDLQKQSAFDRFFLKVPGFADGVSYLRMGWERDPETSLRQLLALNAFMLSVPPNWYEDHSLAVIAAYLVYGSTMLRLGLSRSFKETTIKFLPFEQVPFNRLMDRHFPELGFRGLGNCYGYLNVWYECRLEGKSLMAELSMMAATIEAKQALGTEQVKLLQKITQLQKEQVKPERHFSYSYGLSFNYIRRRMISLALDHAQSKPGTLVAFSPYSSISAHVLGFVAEKNGQFCCFDANVGELSFADRAAVQKGLSRLLAYEYADHPHLGAYFRADNFVREVGEEVEVEPLRENKLRP